MEACSVQRIPEQAQITSNLITELRGKSEHDTRNLEIHLAFFFATNLRAANFVLISLLKSVANYKRSCSICLLDKPLNLQIYQFNSIQLIKL